MIFLPSTNFLPELWAAGNITSTTLARASTFNQLIGSWTSHRIILDDFLSWWVATCLALSKICSDHNYSCFGSCKTFSANFVCLNFFYILLQVDLAAVQVGCFQLDYTEVLSNGTGSASSSMFIKKWPLKSYLTLRQYFSSHRGFGHA